MIAPTTTTLARTLELKAETRDAIRSLDGRIDWGQPPSVPSLIWFGKADWAVVVELDGQLASHVGIVQREIMIGGAPLVVAGITGVMTEPRLQGRGYATLALQRATEFITRSLDVPLALLTCLEHRRTFYEGQGWKVIPNRVICDQPEGKAELTVPGRLMMALEMRGESFPISEIDLRGLPW